MDIKDVTLIGSAEDRALFLKQCESARVFFSGTVGGWAIPAKFRLKRLPNFYRDSSGRALLIVAVPDKGIDSIWVTGSDGLGNFEKVDYATCSGPKGERLSGAIALHPKSPSQLTIYICLDPIGDKIDLIEVGRMGI